MTSSSSLVRKVIAVPCFPARPVRPASQSEAHTNLNPDVHTNTVNIGLDSARHLEINNQTNVLYINTSSGKVSGDKDVRVTITEGCQRSFSLLLILARMEGGGAPLD